MLKLPNPRLHLVYDEDDDVKTAELLNRLADPAAGRVVVDVTPAGRNLDWLAVDIERGLGKNPHLSGAGRNTSDRWSRIHAWLIGGQINTMVVSRIQLLDEQRLRSAITLAIACGVDLWLVAQQKPLPTELAKTLEEWPLEEVALADFRRRWRAGRRQPIKTVEAESQSTSRSFRSTSSSCSGPGAASCSRPRTSRASTPHSRPPVLRSFNGSTPRP